MFMMKFNFVKFKTTYEAYFISNCTTPTGYVKHGTKVLKYLVDPCSLKEI